MHKHFYEHFILPGHPGFLHGVSSTLIDKTDPSCHTKYKDYLIDTLKTKALIELTLIMVIVPEHIAWCFYISAAGFGWLCFRT